MTPITLPALDLANTWLPVFAATSQDDNRPIMHRTICIEWHHQRGIRLVATDSYVLLTGWIGHLDPASDRRHPAPALDEAPDHTIVVADRDHRARQLLTYAAKTARKATIPDDHTITLEVAKATNLDRPVLVEDLASTVLNITLDGATHETVELATVDDDYVSWRSILTHHTPSGTEQLVLSDHVLGVLASIGASIRFRPAGELGPIQITTHLDDNTPPADDQPVVTGIAMPLRPSQADEHTEAA